MPGRVIDVVEGFSSSFLYFLISPQNAFSSTSETLAKYASTGSLISLDTKNKCTYLVSGK